jgi:hypothetical protein
MIAVERIMTAFARTRPMTAEQEKLVRAEVEKFVDELLRSKVWTRGGERSK